jgi:hypothetical protein
MVTKFTYEMTEIDDGYIARCVESPTEATGSTPDLALNALREALAQGLVSVEAIAPPSRPPPAPSIELVPAAHVATSHSEEEPQGPGDSPAAETVGPGRSRAKS